jgi:hypothetical protein
MLKCFDTLESLCIGHFQNTGMFPLASVVCQYNILPRPLDPGPFKTPSPFDLTRATKLKDLEIQSNTPNAHWVTATIQSAKPTNLRRIGILSDMSFDPNKGIAHQGWRDLDRLLVQLWTSHSIHLDIKLLNLGEDQEDVTRSLLPEVTKRLCFSY